MNLFLKMTRDRQLLSCQEESVWIPVSRGEKTGGNCIFLGFKMFNEQGLFRPWSHCWYLIWRFVDGSSYKNTSNWAGFGSRNLGARKKHVTSRHSGFTPRAYVNRWIRNLIIHNKSSYFTHKIFHKPNKTLS